MAQHICSGGFSPAPSARLGRLVLLLAALSSCGSDDSGTAPSQGPLVRLHLSSVDLGTMNAVLKITAKDLAEKDRPGIALTRALRPRR